MALEDWFLGFAPVRMVLEAVLVSSNPSLFVLCFWVNVVVLKDCSFCLPGTMPSFSIFQQMWCSIILSGHGGLRRLFFCAFWAFILRLAIGFEIKLFEALSFLKKWWSWKHWVFEVLVSISLCIEHMHRGTWNRPWFWQLGGSWLHCD